MSDNGPDPRLLGDPLEIDPVRDDTPLEELLARHQQHLQELPADATPVARARVELDIAEARLGLGQMDKAWETARRAFDVCLAGEHWQEAIEACDILYRTEKDLAIPALGMGVWLSVTYPVAPYLTVNMLHHIVDETPDESDGGAVAAAMAHYIADLRAEGKDHESLTFLTAQILARVAKRHRNIEGQDMINTWMDVLQLNDPGELLVRLAEMLDAMVGEHWWFDRDALRARLPVN